MSAAADQSQRSLSSIELIALAGFSLCIGWVLLSFFWLYSGTAIDAVSFITDFAQLAIFAGLAIGYVVLQVLGRNPRFNLFFPPVLCVAFVMCVAQPLLALADLNIMDVPFAAICVVNVLAGLGASALIVSWLDVLSRIKDAMPSRFTAIGFVVGAIAFLVAVSAPENMQPMFAALYVVCSIGLVIFTTHRASANDERAPLEHVAEQWRFTKEIEPAFFMFNVVFALNFVFLFNHGGEAVFVGLLSLIPGAMVIAIIGFLRKPLSVTVLLRVLLVITVLGCILTPFTEGAVQIGSACLLTATWAAFMSANYSLIVSKCVAHRDAPLFRDAPARLCVPALGFAIGWAIAAVLTMVVGEHANVFVFARLVMIVLLVVTVMAFLPNSSHHPAGGATYQEPAPQQPAVSIQMAESEVFDRKCAAIVKMYQLSPREADVFAFLVKGRNASWIQDQLMISPHTVKSHIYNIYRKLDIHSQQRLMSFFEEYPLEL